MITAFDRVMVAVPDLASAVADYRLLLGCEPVTGALPEGLLGAWFGLGNTVIELVQREVSRARVSALVLSADGAGPGEVAIDNSLGLDLYQCDGRHSRRMREDRPGFVSAELLVDHLVLRTGDAQACLDLFAGRLGIRLALDRTVPEWGGRMLFFRAGKLTLEIIESDEERGRGSYFWGLAYQCRDIDATATRLLESGVELSAVRDGRKPGTRVATLKSHCLDIPTLLIEPA